MMLASAGASEEACGAVRAILEDDGMVPTRAACRALGVSACQVRRLCDRHGVRRVSRLGRGGALVNLPQLLNKVRSKG